MCIIFLDCNYWSIHLYMTHIGHTCRRTQCHRNSGARQQECKQWRPKRWPLCHTTWDKTIVAALSLLKRSDGLRLPNQTIIGLFSSSVLLYLLLLLQRCTFSVDLSKSILSPPLLPWYSFISIYFDLFLCPTSRMRPLRFRSASRNYFLYLIHT